MSESNIRKLPADAEQLLNDPRLEGMPESRPGIPMEKLLAPENPPKVGDSPFLLMGHSTEEAGGRVNWIDKPPYAVTGQAGHGAGLAELGSRPRLEETGKRPDAPPEMWPYLSWFVASPRCLEIFLRFDPAAIDSIEIDWVFADGKKLDGYVFLDLRRLINAYDYKRSAVVVRNQFGKKYIHRLAHPRALKEISEPNVHLFREAHFRTHVFASRALAAELASAEIRGIYFQDPASVAAVRFD
jgi:hypothetical protein